MRLYQIFTRLFGNLEEHPVPNGTRAENGCGTLNDLTPQCLASIANLGFTHIWLTGIIDHATTTDYSGLGLPPSTASITKGKAGSPYAIRNYFDIAPDLAKNPSKRMEAFEEAAERIHEAGLRLVIDFVPNHTAREYRPEAGPDPAANDIKAPGFYRDNFYFYLDGGLQMPFAAEFEEYPARATGNDSFTASPSYQDWYETVKVNYGYDPRTGQQDFSPIPATWQFMVEVLRFWAERGVDGFRCDMVDMVPVPFWQYALAQIRALKPDLIFIGESYLPANYSQLIEAGFTFLYDKVGLYDALKDRMLGQASAGQIGLALWEARHLQNALLRFTENHDEPRMPSAAMLGKLAPSLALFFITALTSRHIMVYAGQELGERGDEAEGYSGQDGKTTIFDYWSVPSLRRYANRGAWDTKALQPTERVVRNLYQQILALHAMLEAEGTYSLYNLQAANGHGYGAASLEDGLAVLLTNPEAVGPLLMLVNFTQRVETFSVNIPAEALVGKRPVVRAEPLLAFTDAGPSTQVESTQDGLVVRVLLGAYGCLALRLI